MDLQQKHPSQLTFIQNRANINQDIVNEYAALMQDGVEFDPVSALQDGDQIFVWDGSLRGAAARQLGIPLAVDVRPGTKLEAEWLALTANQKHGLRRTNKDKQHVVRKALRHPFGVKLSNSEIARHCGVNDKTVAKIRRELEASSEIPKIDQRIVRRNGIAYQQNTRNIGAKSVSQSPQTPKLLLNSPPQPVVDLETLPHYPHDLEQTAQLHSDQTASGDNQPKYQLESQPYACPHCGQMKIVGVNGSRRWCLHCMAEWPTATDFLADTSVAQDDPTPTPEQLQDRFARIVARLSNQDSQLRTINNWLDTLEAQVPPPTDDPAPSPFSYALPQLETV